MWGWEEMQEGVRAACCWLGQFFHSHRTPCCVIAKSLTRSISYLCSLCFLPGCLWRYLEVPRDGGKLFQVLSYTLQLWGQPCPGSPQELSHAPALVLPLAAGLCVPLTPQHTERRWYSEMASGLIALFMGQKLLWFQAAWVSSGWVSGISLGCPHR